MEKLIVFTKVSKLNSVDNNFARRNDIFQLNTHLILHYDELNKDFKVANDFNIPGLYFVQDTIPKDNFNTLTESLDKYKMIVLKHRLPAFEMEGFKVVREGAHESTGPYYHKLVNFLMDGENDKISRIIEIFKYDHILEKKLELINKIWNGDSPASFTDDKLKAFNPALSDFNNAIVDKDIFSAGYRAAFQDFKKALKLEE